MTGQVADKSPDKLIVFRTTGEVRRADSHEYCKDGDEIVSGWRLEDSDPRPIYSRHEIESTPDVLRALGMEEEEYDCPIHGKCGGTDGECPRC